MVNIDDIMKTIPDGLKIKAKLGDDLVMEEISMEEVEEHPVLKDAMDFLLKKYGNCSNSKLQQKVKKETEEEKSL